MNSLSENKAEKIVNIDLNGKSEQADCLIIASGTSNRHVTSIAEKLILEVKKNTNIRIRTEGITNADWILIDCGDVIVHIFTEEVRDYYRLERIWSQPPESFSKLENIEK